ncbi:hypothetical protein DB88DRAFT_497601 [Papiliotrema laurentii]|uniref:Transcription initiation factor TFIID subunit 12 domain-containing protein n=1 Tax=Papiliotrema laurentii TaxID=5418 RepID=A0AAD9FQB9_PAPLA|nr:hypothetical protein DB88DRAFT_497601 [Papiliotrema laurentii]
MATPNPTAPPAQRPVRPPGGAPGQASRPDMNSVVNNIPNLFAMDRDGRLGPTQAVQLRQLIASQARLISLRSALKQENPNPLLDLPTHLNPTIPSPNPNGNGALPVLVSKEVFNEHIQAGIREAARVGSLVIPLPQLSKMLKDTPEKRQADLAKDAVLRTRFNYSVAWYTKQAEGFVINVKGNAVPAIQNNASNAANNANANAAQRTPSSNSSPATTPGPSGTTTATAAQSVRPPPPAPPPAAVSTTTTSASSSTPAPVAPAASAPQVAPAAPPTPAGTTAPAAASSATAATAPAASVGSAPPPAPSTAPPPTETPGPSGPPAPSSSSAIDATPTVQVKTEEGTSEFTVAKPPPPPAPPVVVPPPAPVVPVEPEDKRRKRKLKEWLGEMGPGMEFELGVQDIWSELIDGFVQESARGAAKLARHRRSDKVGVKDVAYFLDKTYHLTVPGFNAHVPERVHLAPEVKDRDNRNKKSVAPNAARLARARAAAVAASSSGKEKEEEE